MDPGFPCRSGDQTFQSRSCCMVAVRLNGKAYNCPCSWMDTGMTTRKYIRIMKEWDNDKEIEDRDPFKLFCILTDSPFKQFQATTENEVMIWGLIRWVIEEPFSFSKTPPKALKIKEKIILIPESPGGMSYGANVLLKKEIQGKTLEESIAIATAIYLQPLYDEAKFDINRARELEAAILDMPAYLIYPVGFFLLKNAFPSGSQPAKGWHRALRSLIARLSRMRPTWRNQDGLFHSTTWP